MFLEAAQSLAGTRVVSIGCHDGSAWLRCTAPKLRAVQPTAWFESLMLLHEDVGAVEFPVLFGPSQRVLFFWDMLGFGVTRHILDYALPGLSSRQNLVVVKDVADARYHQVEGAYRVGPLLAASEEVTTLHQFLGSHRLRFATAEHSLVQWQANHADRVAELRANLGTDVDGSDPLNDVNWVYFTVQGVRAPGGHTPWLQRLRAPLLTATGRTSSST